MEDQFTRTRMLIGDDAVQRLANAHVAVFGVGGVGGYVVEVLARSGVGAIDIIDNDTVNITNINRQIIALHSTIGQPKVDVTAVRIKDINPNCRVEKFNMFYLPENAGTIDLSKYDYVVDCIDTVTAKIELIKRCHTLGKPIICSMGTANKMDPTQFRIVDITETSIDPLAKILRKKLRHIGIEHVKVVFSPEQPMKPLTEYEPESDNTSRRPTPASNAFVPAAAGLVIGGEVVKEITIKNRLSFLA